MWFVRRVRPVRFWGSIACLVLLGSTYAFASGGIGLFGASDGWIECRGGVERAAGDRDYITLEMFIFAPSGAVVAHDAMASGYKSYLHTVIGGNVTESGEYRCTGRFDDGQTTTFDERTLWVP